MIPERTETQTRSENSIARSDGTWKTKYGSKKTYSDNEAKRNSITVKITDAKITYRGLENTRLSTFINFI